MTKYDIAIIGAGAAGSMAAIFASLSGKKIILIERNNKIGKKILATGNGRCNVTNIGANSSKYHGSNPQFINAVLNTFNPHKVMEFFESLGVMLKEEDQGRIFPRNNQAESIVHALYYELDKPNITLKLNSLVKSIKKNSNWHVKLENGEQIIADKIIITTGGKCAFQYGSSGDGYYWVEKLGHKIIQTYPALVAIETKENWVKNIQGIKVECRVTTIVNNIKINEKTGDILFTHFGISGPAAMAQARAIGPNLDKNTKIHLDLFPDISSKELYVKIKKMIKTNCAKSIKNCLSGLIPGNLAIQILANLKINKDEKSGIISEADRNKIVETLKNIELTPQALRSYKEAQVTAGGIGTSKIDQNTMQSKIVSGLYFAGEIIDVDGDSGGYNLQWAWSSGSLAGISAVK